MRAFVLALAVAGCAGRPGVPTYTEPTGWAVCYEADGTVADYDGNCKNARLIEWDLPISVYVPEDYPNNLRVQEAMAVWDQWLGTMVFRDTENKETADVAVVDGGPSIWAAGMAVHTKIQGRIRFELSMYSPYYDRPDVLAHEFGHVLGLAHDPNNKLSIMYPGTEWSVPGLSEADCDYLKALYPNKVRCD